MTTSPTARVVYLVPTRGRPDRVRDGLLPSWEATRAGTADLVLAVDDDDPHLDAYQALQLPPWAELVVGPRLRLGGTLNALAPQLCRGYEAVGFMGDDHRPRTVGWDARLAVELDGNPAGVIYGDDLVHGRGLPTAVLLGSPIIAALGWYVPPGMVHLWLDNYWLELGRALGTLRFRSDVIIEHEHPIAGRAEWDATYAEANDDAVFTNDERRLRQFIANGGLIDAAAIIRHHVEEITK